MFARFSENATHPPPGLLTSSTLGCAPGGANANGVATVANTIGPDAGVAEAVALMQQAMAILQRVAGPEATGVLGSRPLASSSDFASEASSSPPGREEDNELVEASVARAPQHPLARKGPRGSFKDVRASSRSSRNSLMSKLEC